MLFRSIGQEDDDVAVTVEPFEKDSLAYALFTGLPQKLNHSFLQEERPDGETATFEIKGTKLVVNVERPLDIKDDSETAAKLAASRAKIPPSNTK